MIYIYGLRCPIEGVIRYVGKSINPKKRRLAHIGSALRCNYNHHTSRWIRRLHSSGHAPELVILHVVQDGEKWQDIERSMIASAPSRGWRLTNSTAGGEGLDYTDEAAKAAYRLNACAAMKRVWNTPENRQRARERSIKAWADPEVTARRLESFAKMRQDPTYRARNLAALLDVAKDPVAQAKKSASVKRSWGEIGGERRRAALESQEVRAKMSASAKARWQDPLQRKALAVTDEKRAKLAAAARNRSTPEYRAMMAEKTRVAWAKRRATKEPETCRP